MDEVLCLFTDFDGPYHESIARLRFEVFVDEQKVPVELEIDEHDAAASHMVAIMKDRVIGTLRIVRFENYAKIGRLVVKREHRRRGIATGMMQMAIDRIVEDGASLIALDAQVAAIAFYKQLGFHPVGDVFDDAGIPHVRMERNIGSASR